nr:pilin [Parahaliea mediterranea]
MQKQVQQGFTLIELMIVIAIVGILAAIALPAYQDYTVRAKMSEPLAVMAEAKTSLAEYYSANGFMPASETIAGINTNPNTEIVASLDYTSSSGATGGALLTVSVKSAVIPGATANQTFQLSGTTDSITRKVTWKCRPDPSGSNAVAAKYLPANCRG